MHKRYDLRHSPAPLPLARRDQPARIAIHALSYNRLLGSLTYLARHSASIPTPRIHASRTVCRSRRRRRAACARARAHRTARGLRPVGCAPIGAEHRRESHRACRSGCDWRPPRLRAREHHRCRRQRTDSPGAIPALSAAADGLRYRGRNARCKRGSHKRRQPGEGLASETICMTAAKG